jgi:hypothetical protein
MKHSLPQKLQEAVEQYDKWIKQVLEDEETAYKITEPLYHYTNGVGLTGILSSRDLWFTDYRHVNDPSEMVHGIALVHDVIHQLESGCIGPIRRFLSTLATGVSQKNFSLALEYFIAGLSKDRDDLGQWRAYADNGRGYAIGFTPRVFRVTDEHVLDPHNDFLVSPVIYNIHKAMQRHRTAVENAISIISEVYETSPQLLPDEPTPFYFEIAKAITASPIIINCLTTKHPAYAHEQEVRLVRMGLRKDIAGSITTRVRGSEIVPYIAHRMPIAEPNSLVEIVVGPSAAPDSERSVRTLLDSLGYGSEVQVSRSDIPYRAQS